MPKELRFPLNVYLIRDGHDSTTSAFVETSGFPAPISLSVGEQADATFYYGQKQAAPPWIGTLLSLADEPAAAPVSASVSGLLIVRLKKRTFVLTFGHAWQRVSSRSVEPNFGIRCVLNLAEPNSLRAIRRDRVAEDSIQAIEQIPDSDDIHRFGIDVEKDLLRGVKARVDPKHLFGPWVAGADSFKGSVDLAAESIGQYLERCLLLYKKSSYRSNFKWVDNISPIRDPALEARLTTAMAKKAAKKGNDLALCVPDLLSWDDYDFFSFWSKKHPKSSLDCHLDISSWRAYMKSIGEPINDVALKETFVRACRDDGTIGGKWPVLSCLHGTVTHGGRTYLAHGGNWFSLNPSFVSEVNSRVAAIPYSKLKLPPTTLKEKEGDYNARIAGGSSGKLLCLDKKLISVGGGKSKVEVCDLISEDGHLVCVKPWGGGSSSLSHLFQQARVSIQLINDVPYCTSVRTKISGLDAKFSPVWDAVCQTPGKAEVVLAALRGCPKESLPFFARLSLANCAEDLRKMRFKVTYTAISP